MPPVTTPNNPRKRVSLPFQEEALIDKRFPLVEPDGVPGPFPLHFWLVPFNPRLGKYESREMHVSIRPTEEK